MGDFFEDMERAWDAMSPGPEVTPDEVRRIQQDWQELFWGSERGQRVLGDMLRMSGFFGSSFTGNSKTYFLEGQKYFVSLIIRFAGLDDAEGLHQLASLKIRTEHQRSKANE